MSTVYVTGTVGPWYVDDTAVRCDGSMVNSQLRLGPPAVDGLRSTGTDRRPSFIDGGLHQGARDTGFVRSE